MESTSADVGKMVEEYRGKFRAMIERKKAVNHSIDREKLLNEFRSLAEIIKESRDKPEECLRKVAMYTLKYMREASNRDEAVQRIIKFFRSIRGSQIDPDITMYEDPWSLVALSYHPGDGDVLLARVAHDGTRAYMIRMHAHARATRAYTSSAIEVLR